MMHSMIPCPINNGVLNQINLIKNGSIVEFKISRIKSTRVTWKARVLKSMSIILRGHLALYDLCAHCLCAPAVIPNPDITYNKIAIKETEFYYNNVTNIYLRKINEIVFTKGVRLPFGGR